VWSASRMVSPLSPQYRSAHAAKAFRIPSIRSIQDPAQFFLGGAKQSYSKPISLQCWFVMENAASRSTQGSPITSNSSIASIPRATPRKNPGVPAARTICTGGGGDESTDEWSTKDKERGRFFRLMSPKKALARKAQARKNAVHSEVTRVPALTPETMDAIGILPFTNQGDALRGRAAVRRTNITCSNQALSEIERSVEDDDDSIVGIDDDDFTVDEVNPQEQIGLRPRPTPSSAVLFFAPCCTWKSMLIPVERLASQS
jgi:hypothetical protein